MTQSTSETVTFYLEKILQSVHPLMAEGLYLAAVPHWYNQRLFAAMRSRDDGRDEGLIERLTRYSFVARLGVDDHGQQTYAIRDEDRALIQRYWIMKEPAAYRMAHERALAFWQANPDPNPFAQAQSRLYHQLFVDQDAAANYLIDRFRAYYNDRQLAAIDRLLETVEEARFYLALLNDAPLAGLDDLLIHLQARLSQARGDWAASLVSLQKLRQKADLIPQLKAYVTRAYGYALTQTGDFVGAIAEYESALAKFQQRDTDSSQQFVIEDSSTLKAEQAQTMIALGDAHVGLARTVHSQTGRQTAEWGRLRPLRDIFIFIVSLPLLVFLSPFLGWRVWRPRFWPTLIDLDWIVARLFATGARYYQQADPILEEYGDPGEAVAADEKLAFLYLVMGDAEQAQSQFEQLLAKTEAPLGEYRQAAVRLGLGQALLREGNAETARSHLEQALPVLRTFEDKALEAAARGALAQALFETGEKTEAIAKYGQAARLFQFLGDWEAATSTVEQMEALVAADEADPGLRDTAAAVSDKLIQRQYGARFRHPLLVQFQRFILLLLPLILLLMPLLVIRLDTGIALSPIIQFKAAPIFDPSQVASSELSQGVTTANVVSATDAETILWLAIALVAVYVLGSLLLGLILIIFTPLSTVQARGRAATIHLDDQDIRLGGDGQMVNWAGVTEMVKGDVRLWQRPIPIESAFVIASPEERLVINGNTNWYESLRRRAEQMLPDSAQIVDLDTGLLQGKLGRIYVINVVLIGLLLLLTWLAPRLLWLDFPGLPYSLADLYPYLYLGLAVVPTWWIVIRPLRTHLRLNPYSRLGWWAFGGGMLLALLQAATLFRPLLTAVNLYPPLVTLMIIGGAAWTIWGARVGGRPVYPPWQRLGTAVLAGFVCLLMAFLLWREAAGYHFLVLGNNRRDSAQLAAAAERQEELLAGAVRAYGQAIQISGTPILGIDPRTAARIPFGIPEPHSFTWLAALTNRAALQVQLGRYAQAIGSYNIILQYTDRPADVYAWRAIARQSWSTTDTGEGKLDTIENQYELALEDFEQAIELDKGRAVYYLWRGVVHHALNNTDQAWADYEKALSLTGEDVTPLTNRQRERALTGQGWLKYNGDAFAEAQALFEEAVQANPEEAEAWVGAGYAAFSQELYADAAVFWEEAFALEPTDPTVLISLGTLHWKLGGQTDDDGVKCAEYGQSADFFTQATAVPGQEPESLAFTFRTLGQVQSLLRGCPSVDRTAQYQATIDSYTQAIQLDPDNLDYYQKRARWTFALWSDAQTPREEEWLYTALEDITEAYLGGMRDDTTLTFRRAILNVLEPRVLEKAADFMAAGEFEAALAEYALLARSQPEKIVLAFQAGLAALGAGNEAQSQAWYGGGIRAALDDEDSVSLLTQALDALESFLQAYPAVDGRQIQMMLAEALNEARAGDPGTLFSLGLTALNAGRESDAELLIRQGLIVAAEKKQFEPVRTAVLNLVALPDTDNGSVLALFHSSWPQLAAAAAEETDVAGAFDLGYVALALDEMESAAVWYNEGIRRTVINNQYPVLRATRDDLRRLWVETGVTSNKLIAAMDAHLPAQLNDHPALNEDGLYWRFRAWFKYGLGLAAYRLDNETAAVNALLSGQGDADVAYDLDSAGNAYVQTYLKEGAWGWYNVVRGDDAYNEGDYETALRFYELSAKAFRPDNNGDARSEATLAAFKAGLISVQLGMFDQAAEWYGEGLRRAAAYDTSGRINEARAELLAVQTVRPELAAEIEVLLELFPTE